MKIHVLSLGCDKNLVDSEAMVGLLGMGGFSIEADPAKAEIVIVNTCGFIAEATREAIQSIMEMGKLKAEGSLKALIVTGCLAARYKEQILSEMPEVDAVLGIEEFSDPAGAIAKALSGRVASFGGESLDSCANRAVSTSGYAYLKIAEGCDNRCSYCTIPSIKGRYRSREMESLLEEARSLADQGIREIVLVAQDTSLYGTDLYNEPKLPELMRKLSEIEDVEWIRLLYAYPERVTSEIIDEMASNPKVCHYIDIPIQHAADTVLGRMGRRGRRDELEALLLNLREAMPDIAVRTTLIVGFPGETEEDFKCLLDFVEKAKFDKLGVFAYSQEEGTPAASMPDQIDEKVKESRKKKVMRLQQRVSKEKNKALVGKTLKAMVDGRLTAETGEEGFVYCARSQRDCAGVDGMIFFNSPTDILTGEFVEVEINKSGAHDLYGALVE
ncbi:MAG: 30S ribosomal protein S12 methylthiotransferase RimO [Clostridiales bacterium]|nr:30S ribosomal protein S12 methylthiotransferase RimO [Clostridiales bacterium]